MNVLGYKFMQIGKIKDSIELFKLSNILTKLMEPI